MKGTAKKLCKEAERLGYVFSHTNSKNYMIYAAPWGHEVQISPSASEHQARAIAKEIKKAAGTYQPPVGRSGGAVKDRQAKRRELDAERLAAERQKNQAERDAYLARIAAAPNLTADPAVLRLYEEREREFKRMEALMRSTPASGDHQGRRPARHTSGERGARDPRAST